MNRACAESGGRLGEQVEALQSCMSALIAQSNPWAWGLTHVVALTVALLALIGVGITVWQHYRANRDDQLWSRMQWALAHVEVPDDNAKMVGLLAIERLLTDNGTRKGFRLTAYDEGLLEDVADIVLADTRPSETEHAHE